MANTYILVSSSFDVDEVILALYCCVILSTHLDSKIEKKTSLETVKVPEFYVQIHFKFSTSRI